MSELVEKVARAAFETNHLAGPLGDEPPVEWGRGGYKTEVIAWEATARAAIATVFDWLATNETQGKFGYRAVFRVHLATLRDEALGVKGD